MQAWEGFLAQLDGDLGQEVVNQWLRTLKVLRYDAGNLYLEAPDSFKIHWFDEHVRPLAQTLLRNQNQKPLKIHLSLGTQEPSAKEKAKKLTTVPSTLPPFALHFDEIAPESSFDSFVTSQGNLLAYKLLSETCEDICQEKPLPFNPIYLFGRSGTGKTHLLMATTNALRSKGKKVLYVRAETFTEHVVNAIRKGEMQAFRKAYRHIDALILDDIEILSRKGATQEELFHTFNTLHTTGKLIILASGLSPQELKSIEPRLVSRFEWGIVIPIQTLNKEGLREILLRNAQRAQFELDENLLNFLLDSFGHQAKSLIKALEALILRLHLQQGLDRAPPHPLPVNYAKRLLADLLQEQEQNLLTPGKIIRTVADYYGIRIDDLLSKSQSRDCVVPRQIAMHLCRHHLHLPYMKIGDIFSRDHSTVMTSVKQIEKELEGKNLEIAGPISGILKRLEIN